MSGELLKVSGQGGQLKYFCQKKSWVGEIGKEPWILKKKSCVGKTGNQLWILKKKSWVDKTGNQLWMDEIWWIFQLNLRSCLSCLALTKWSLLLGLDLNSPSSVSGHVYKKYKYTWKYRYKYTYGYWYKYRLPCQALTKWSLLLGLDLKLAIVGHLLQVQLLHLYPHHLYHQCIAMHCNVTLVLIAMSESTRVTITCHK